MWVHPACHRGLRDPRRTCSVLNDPCVIFTSFLLRGLVRDQCRAAHLNSVTTLEKAFVEIRATFTLNNLVPQGLIFAASCVSPNDNLRVTQIAVEIIVIRCIVACRNGKISADASTTVTFPAFIHTQPAP